MQMPSPQTEKKKPRLTQAERIRIEEMLNGGLTPYKIAKTLGRPPKTVMREIVNRAIESMKGAVGRISNRCVHRYDCQRRNAACKKCLHANRSMLCRFCRQCNTHCPDYIEQDCEKLKSSPFVCNGCAEKSKCPLRKKLYVADDAQANYRNLLVKSREGANITEEELLAMDNLIYTLTSNGQSVHAAAVNNPDVIPVSEKTIYRYIDGGLLKTKNGDLPRKCKLAPRKSKGVEHKVDAQCRINRTMEDYYAFINRNPGLPVTEMDTVEGTKGGKVLLTFMFMPYSFMLAFLLDTKTSANVTSTFRMIRDRLIGKFGKDAGLAIMSEIFYVILTDNGTEFSNPAAIEVDCDGNRIANLFYCNPGASYQKPHVERNHEGIRLVLPKGDCYLLPISFDNLTQADVDTMMSHVNSYVRPALGDKTPYDLFTNKFGTDGRPYHGAALSRHLVSPAFKPHLTFTLSNSVEVNAKSVRVNGHRCQQNPKLWAFTLSIDQNAVADDLYSRQEDELMRLNQTTPAKGNSGKTYAIIKNRVNLWSDREEIRFTDKILALSKGVPL